MGVRRFEDLIAWQLAEQVQREVFAFTAIGPAARDFKFRDQIRDSSASVTRNIAEGFGRYLPREFARFLRIAAGSMHETVGHLHDARTRGYLMAEEYEAIRRLALRSIKATTRLIAYLSST